MGRRKSERLLSPRQFDCLQGVADHLASEQIAERLGVSPHTVNGHLATAIATLEATSRRDAVRRYLIMQEEHPEKLAGQFLRVAGPPIYSQPAPMPVTVEERRPELALFTPPPPVPEVREEHYDLIPHVRLIALIVAIAVGGVILLIALEPLAQSAMRLANAIQPYHHNPDASADRAEKTHAQERPRDRRGP